MIFTFSMAGIPVRISALGAVLFLGGWIYAIVQFGVFLGVSLGWIPAFFFALILELVIILVSIPFVRWATSGEVIDGSPHTTGPSLGEAWSARAAAGWNAAKPRIRRLLILGAAACVVFAGYLVFQNEISGQCEELSAAYAARAAFEADMAARGVDLEYVRSASGRELWALYGADFLSSIRTRMFFLNQDIVSARMGLAWPDLCPITIPDL